VEKTEGDFLRESTGFNQDEFDFEEDDQEAPDAVSCLNRTTRMALT
jgi:hypothetical protein